MNDSQGGRRVVRVKGRNIDEAVLDAALKVAGGSPSRLDWDNARVVDGVIVEIRVLNEPKR